MPCSLVDVERCGEEPTIPWLAEIQPAAKRREAVASKTGRVSRLELGHESQTDAASGHLKLCIAWLNALATISSVRKSNLMLSLVPTAPFFVAMPSQAADADLADEAFHVLANSHDLPDLFTASVGEQGGDVNGARNRRSPLLVFDESSPDFSWRNHDCRKMLPAKFGRQQFCNRWKNASLTSIHSRREWRPARPVIWYPT